MVIYYLESDQHHVAAISQDGKLLWCCEILSYRKFRVADLRLNGDHIDVVLFMSGYGVGTINKKTGTYSPPMMIQ